MKSSGLDIAEAVLAAARLIGPPGLARAYGPYAPAGTAKRTNVATTRDASPEDESEGEAVQPEQAS